MVAQPPNNASDKTRTMKQSTAVRENIHYNELQVMDAWERFLTGSEKETQPDNVRSIIHESWHRSASKGIDAQFKQTPSNLDHYELESRKENYETLIKASDKTFSNIGKRLNGTEAMLVLSDKEGTIIKATGDGSTINAGRDIHLSVGGVWNENAIGTNAIGTALCTGKPVFVHAAEHFCAGIKAWTCAGAPIRDPADGTVLGVIDLSGPPNIFQKHNMALIATAAREIEEALIECNYIDRLKLLDEFFNSTSGLLVNGEGFIILDQHGRVAFCQDGSNTSLLAVSKDVIRQGAQLIDMKKAKTDNDIFNALPENLRYCSIDILGNKKIDGAVLIFPNKKTSKKSIKKSFPSSAQTTFNNLNQDNGNNEPNIVGDDPEVLKAIDAIKRIANSPSNTAVLIEGETGTGKELFAKLMHCQVQNHQNKKSKNKPPFVVMNCGAISKELFGGELFGHVSGSFTGALKDGKAGKFELANGGVLCLDEIGELPLDIQPFLLRVLEERVVYRIGEEKARPINLKLVSSTNKDLEQEVSKGHFRQDLYYRISSVTISIPPLRERGNDILKIIDHFNHEITQENSLEPLKFSPQVKQQFLNYSWPGNVRELKNLIENLHLLLPHRNVEVSDLPKNIQGGAVPTITLQNNFTNETSNQQEEHTLQPSTGEPMTVETLEDAEKEMVLQAIENKKGNLSQVAKQLGISRPTLYRKLDLYNIKRQYSS